MTAIEILHKQRFVVESLSGRMPATDAALREGAEKKPTQEPLQFERNERGVLWRGAWTYLGAGLVFPYVGHASGAISSRVFRFNVRNESRIISCDFSRRVRS